MGRDTRGDNLVRYSDGGGHCFSCNYHEHPPFSNRFSSPFLLKENVPKALLPSDFTREVPGYALKWLLQWGLPYSQWKESIGFSPKEERLIFCVGQPTAFSIGRYVGPEVEGHKPRKWYVWGDCHKHCEVIGGPTTEKTSPVVLVEDILSAHKVGASGFTSIPLFGTVVHKPVLYYLFNCINEVVLWLDKDQEQQSRAKALNLASLIGRHVRVVTTDNDPKTYTEQNIKDVLNA